MPKGTLRVFPISEHESCLYIRISNDTESDAILVRKDHPALIIRLAEMAVSVGFVRLFNGDMFAVDSVAYANVGV